MSFVSTRRLVAGLVAAAAATVAVATTPAQAAVASGILVIDDVTVFDVPPGVPTTVLVPVRLDAPLDHKVAFEYRTSDGTATANQDYRPVRGGENIGVNETLDFISVTITSDADDIRTEHFFVNLTEATGAEIADRQAVITINDCIAVCTA